MVGCLLLVLLAAVALVQCAATVPLDGRGCPCADGWLCCAESAKHVVCLPPGVPCKTCVSPWQATEDYTLCSNDQDTDLCKSPTPNVQIDVNGIVDECSKQGDPNGPGTPIDCSKRFSGTNVQGMTVEMGELISTQGPDRCRLFALPQ